MSAMILAAHPARAAWLPDGNLVSTNPGAKHAPVVAPDGAGGAFIAYEDSASGTSDIFLQRITSSGDIATSWPSIGIAITNLPGSDYWIHMVPDGSGGVFVTWTDGRQAGTLQGRDVYLTRIMADGAQSPGWPAGGLPVGGAGGDQVYSRITGDGAGGVIVCWSDARTGPGPGLMDIYAQRVSGAGVASWTANGVAICTESHYQGPSQLVSDGAGGAFVAWGDERSGGLQWDVYLMRVTAAGSLAPGWPVDGLAVCNAGEGQLPKALIMDGVGGALLAWTDYRSGPGAREVYGSRITSTGSLATGWTPNGTALCSTPGDRELGTGIPDGSGGMLLVWRDYNLGGIHALRVTGNGSPAPGWPGNGTLVNDGPELQWIPTAAPDGSGGAIVAWMDERASEQGDIYGGRITGGAAVPVPEGFPLCAATGGQNRRPAHGDGPNRPGERDRRDERGG